MAKSDVKNFGSEERVNLLLQESGVYYLSGEISEENVTPLIKWLLSENLSKRRSPLTLYINSHGGDLYQAFALIDIMKVSKMPIRTVGLGHVMSSAFLIFASGTKGMRQIAHNASAMCHQFSDEPSGKYHDIKAQVIEIEHCNRKMLEILEAATELSASTIKAKLLPASDVYLTAEELLNFNIADEILAS